MNTDDKAEGVNRCIYKSVVNILESKKTIVGLTSSNVDIENALNLRPSCRFQRVKQRVKSDHQKSVDIILDVAHNFDAIKALKEKVRTTYSNAHVRVVIGICADKDVLNCIPLILSICPLHHIHCVSARNPRSVEAHQLMRELTVFNGGIDRIDTNETKLPRNYQNYANKSQGIREALRNAINISGEKMTKNEEVQAVVVVFGTAFIMSECRSELGIIEAKDADALVRCRNHIYSDAQENFDGS